MCLMCVCWDWTLCVRQHEPGGYRYWEPLVSAYQCGLGLEESEREHTFIMFSAGENII